MSATRAPRLLAAQLAREDTLAVFGFARQPHPSTTIRVTCACARALRRGAAGSLADPSPVRTGRAAN
jgi:hypothetical protein